MIFTQLAVAPSMCPSLPMTTVVVSWQEQNTPWYEHQHVTRFFVDDLMQPVRGEIKCDDCDYKPAQTGLAHELLTRVLQEVVPIQVYQDWGSVYRFQVAHTPL